MFVCIFQLVGHFHSAVYSSSWGIMNLIAILLLGLSTVLFILFFLSRTLPDFFYFFLICTHDFHGGIADVSFPGEAKTRQRNKTTKRTGDTTAPPDKAPVSRGRPRPRRSAPLIVFFFFFLAVLFLNLLFSGSRRGSRRWAAILRFVCVWLYSWAFSIQGQTERLVLSRI